MASNVKQWNLARNKRKWSERYTLKFAELYEAEVVLWDVRLKEYKNKDARNAALQRMVKNLEIDCVTTKIEKIILDAPILLQQTLEECIPLLPKDEALELSPPPPGATNSNSPSQQDIIS
ncbi:unnamed protein product [Parnassius mnemosyne]|uniref:MADF domain-containing protein n=1 Tax=Parnassius mnemosyne TaxID=213953 RepID=A0AAV1L9S3_9NEOP